MYLVQKSSVFDLEFFLSGMEDSVAALVSLWFDF